MMLTPKAFGHVMAVVRWIDTALHRQPSIAFEQPKQMLNLELEKCTEGKEIGPTAIASANLPGLERVNISTE